MAQKDELPGGALLPTVGVPGTFEWCEEVVECMNAAWRTRETAERSFLAAVRAAVRYRIWETLAPPFPEEPYGSLEGLIRRKAEAGQAENMQIAIRFSGVLHEVAAEAGGDEDDRDRAAGREALLPASGPSGSEARVSLPAGQVPRQSPAGGQGGAFVPPLPGRPLSEEEEIALGNRLLEEYAAQLAAAGMDPEQAAALAAEQGDAGGGESGTAPASRVSATQRKRERLERTHPELMEAVQAGEITLKQAYVQAGIEKQVPTLDKLQRLWKTASDEEHERFLTWLHEEEQRQRKREYEEEVYGGES